MRDAPCLTVYFDGFCPVCRREVGVYRRLHAPGAIHWQDLAATPGVLSDVGVDLQTALTWLHVRDADGVVHTGLDAHCRMWERLPLLHVLAWLIARSPRLRRGVDALYRWFTPRRPGLVLRRARSAG